MIAIATGFDALDKKIEEVFMQNGINDTKIVNYREFLLQQNFDTIIMSKNLTGQIEFEFLVFSLRGKNVRLIFLTNEKDINELKTCLDYGVYDLIFDPIVPAQVFNVYQNPKTFADAKNVFVIVKGGDDKNKSRDIEKLMKMEEMQYVSLKQENMQQNQQNANQRRDSFNDKSANTNVNNNMSSNGYNNMNYQDERSLPKMTKETRMDMPNVQNIPNSNFERPSQPTPQVERPVMQDIPQSQPQPQAQQDFGSPFGNNDFSRDMGSMQNNGFENDKKRIIKETEIQSVYQVPYDYKKTIVLLSPESTGKTTIAINMAWYFNKKGIKTTLIDTDFKKKDIYYSFPIDVAECLSNVKNTEDVSTLGINVGKNLTVYTEHKDVDVNLELYDITKLITTCKKNSQVVIIDLDYSLNPEIIRNVLENADDVAIVVDQKVTTLNRVPEELYVYRNQLQRADLIVNRYYNIKHLEKDRVRDFFRGIDVYSGKTFDILINRVFPVSDDAKSVLQGLAERTPTIEIRDNLLEDDIKEICESYYMIGKKDKKKFR